MLVPSENVSKNIPERFDACGITQCAYNGLWVCLLAFLRNVCFYLARLVERVGGEEGVLALGCLLLELLYSRTVE